jgi:hypothetical protein
MNRTAAMTIDGPLSATFARMRRAATRASIAFPMPPRYAPWWRAPRRRRPSSSMPATDAVMLMRGADGHLLRNAAGHLVKACAGTFCVAGCQLPVSATVAFAGNNTSCMGSCYTSPPNLIFDYSFNAFNPTITVPYTGNGGPSGNSCLFQLITSDGGTYVRHSSHDGSCSGTAFPSDTFECDLEFRGATLLLSATFFRSTFFPVSYFNGTFTGATADCFGPIVINNQGCSVLHYGDGTATVRFNY